MFWELLKTIKIIKYYQNNKFHSILTRFCKYNNCKICSSIYIFIDFLTLQQLSQGGGHNLKASSLSVEDPVTNLATYFVLYEIVFDNKHSLPLFTDF